MSYPYGKSGWRRAIRMINWRVAAKLLALIGVIVAILLVAIRRWLR